MKGFLQYFMNYGLVAAVVVWAAVVGLMAYHLDESPWRWAFIALVAAGLATVAGILRIRKYVDGLGKSSEQEMVSERKFKDAQKGQPTRPQAMAKPEA